VVVGTDRLGGLTILPVADGMPAGLVGIAAVGRDRLNGARWRMIGATPSGCWILRTR
jgi:hypothetical protein